MIRIVKLTQRYYGFDMEHATNDEIMSQIESFISQGSPVLLVEDIEDAEQFDIDPDDIEMVKGTQ